ncbi:hypothetical protein Tco_1459202 [Tanacetum coccineum]
MTPIFEYLTEETLPADVKKARALLTTSQSGLKQNWLQPSLAIRSKNSCGTTLSADLDSHERLSRIMENSWGQSFKEVRGTTMYALTQTLCLFYHIANQWPGRKNKSQSRRRNKSKAGCKEQELDGRALSCYKVARPHRLAELAILCNIGTPLHDKIRHRAHSFLIKHTETELRRYQQKLDALPLNSESGPSIKNEALEINLDLLEERREQAAIREARSKSTMEKYYNSKVRSTSFKPGDLVYRNNDASRAEDTWKLCPKWEGPYEVTKALGKGAYKLRDRDGKQLPRTWNVSNLKKCYIHKM